MTGRPSLRTRALRYLARREHSRLELERKLASHAKSPEELDSVLDALERSGFLSAVRVVEQVVHVRKSKFGSRRIVHELREKGIPENLIAAALPNMMETEQDRALEVWRKGLRPCPPTQRSSAGRLAFSWGEGSLRM